MNSYERDWKEVNAQKPTHEIGWEDELREFFDKCLKPKKETMKNLERELLVDFVSKTLTHQKESMRAEHLKDISQHRGGAFKHGRSVGIKETKESMVSKLEGMKRTAYNAPGSPSENEAMNIANYNHALADAVEVVKGI